MAEALFPDNTVLCNFAAVDRLALLRSVLGERGRWTEAVAYEAGNSARHLPALAGLAGSGWLGEPIEVTSDAARDAFGLMSLMADRDRGLRLPKSAGDFTR